MMGISYGGISQLFVAATDPPALAAIAPLSVIDNTATTLYPGGILNTGFALSWAKERDHDAEPASPRPAARRGRCSGSAAATRPAAPTRCCMARRSTCSARFARTATTSRRSPTRWPRSRSSRRSRCPCSSPASGPTSRPAATAPTSRALHRDPAEVVHLHQRRPHRLAGSRDVHPLVRLPGAVRGPRGAPCCRPRTGARAALYEAAMGIPGVTLPADPIQSSPTYAAALAAFQRLPPVRVLFDNGAGARRPARRCRVRAFVLTVPAARVPRRRSWYLGRGGALAGRHRGSWRGDAFTWKPGRGPPTDFTGDTGPGGLWRRPAGYHWTQNPAGTALVLPHRAPRGEHRGRRRRARCRRGSRPSAPNVDLQVTVTEVRPDGNETFVQTGWLRADERKLSRTSTLLEPLPTLRQADVRAAAEGSLHRGHRAALLRGPCLPAGIADPDHDCGPRRRSAALGVRQHQPDGARHGAVAYSRKMPSRLILPVVPGVAVPTGAAAVPKPPQRAVPGLSAVRQPGRVGGDSRALGRARRSEESPVRGWARCAGRVEAGQPGSAQGTRRVVGLAARRADQRAVERRRCGDDIEERPVRDRGGVVAAAARGLARSRTGRPQPSVDPRQCESGAVFLRVSERGATCATSYSAQRRVGPWRWFLVRTVTVCSRCWGWLAGGNPPPGLPPARLPLLAPARLPLLAPCQIAPAPACPLITSRPAPTPPRLAPGLPPDCVPACPPACPLIASRLAPRPAC